MNQIALKLLLAACALGSVAPMSFEALSSNLEQLLSSEGGTCASGSIETILQGTETDCPAFVEIVLALDANEGEAEQAALHLLLENVKITEESLQGEDKDLFVDESDDYTFETKADEFDQFACSVQEILNKDGDVVGTRSFPSCVEDRINEAEAVIMEYKMLEQTSGATTDDSSTPAPQSDPTAAPQAEPTEAPLDESTATPQADPTEAPQAEPTEAPLDESTAAPQADPTEAPLVNTTEAPQAEPTEAPQADQTEAPQAEPTEAPLTNATEPTDAPGTWEAPVDFVEEQLAQGGTCEDGSILTLVSDGEADCPAFTKVVWAIAEEGGDFVQAAYKLVIANVNLEEASLEVPVEDFVDENTLYTFNKMENEFDEYGCEFQDITEIATNMIVGMRSDPDCVFLRVAEIHIIVLVEGDGPVPEMDADHATIEGHFSSGGTCDAGSVDLILAGDDADCEVFVEVVEALDKSELNFRHAANDLLLARITVDDSTGVNAEDLIHDHDDFSFSHENVELDNLGCHKEDIIETSSGDIVGSRSDPECVLLRTAQVEVIVVVDRFVETDDVANEGISLDGSNESDPIDNEGVPLDVVSNETDPIGSEGVPFMDGAINNTTNNGANPGGLADEGIPLGDMTPSIHNSSSYVNGQDGIPLEVSGYNENNTVEFGNLEDPGLVCINETIEIDSNPEVGKQQDFATNNKQIQEQVFLINQKLLDYTNVDTATFESTCTANNGVFLIANVSSLCRRRSIFDDRILQRVTYLGRNFPVCAGQQCAADDDYHLVFAHSLLTGHEFYHSTEEGEFWTCASSAWSMSISVLVGIATAATWFLM